MARRCGAWRHPCVEARDVASGPVEGVSPLCRLLRSSVFQGGAYGSEWQIGGVHRGSGLLTPGIIQAAGIEAVEAEVVEQPDHDHLGHGVVACNRCGEPFWRAGGTGAGPQTLRADCVQRLDDGVAQLHLGPATLDHPGVQLRNRPVSHRGHVVTRVYDDHTAWQVVADGGPEV